MSEEHSQEYDKKVKFSKESSSDSTLKIQRCYSTTTTGHCCPNKEGSENGYWEKVVCVYGIHCE